MEVNTAVLEDILDSSNSVGDASLAESSVHAPDRTVRSGQFREEELEDQEDLQ